MAEYNMPQYILREFKVTDARVSQGRQCFLTAASTDVWESNICLTTEKVIKAHFLMPTSIRSRRPFTPETSPAGSEQRPIYFIILFPTAGKRTTLSSLIFGSLGIQNWIIPEF